MHELVKNPPWYPQPYPYINPPTPAYTQIYRVGKDKNVTPTFLSDPWKIYINYTKQWDLLYMYLNSKQNLKLFFHHDILPDR